MSNHIDTSVGALISQYKNILANLEQIQQTNPDAVINTYMVYEHGEITPLLLTNNKVITESNPDDNPYDNKSTYLGMNLQKKPYEFGSLVFIPVSKEEDYQVTYKEIIPDSQVSETSTN